MKRSETSQVLQVTEAEVVYVGIDPHDRQPRPFLAGEKLIGRRSPAMSFTAAHLYFDDVQVGQEWESLGRTVTQADIVNFAGLSGDFNPIHMDHEFCKNTTFRQPIAHGLLVLSMGSGLGLQYPPDAYPGVRGHQGMEIHRTRVHRRYDSHRKPKSSKKRNARRGKRGVITWQRTQSSTSTTKRSKKDVIVTLVEGQGAAKPLGSTETATS